MEIRLDGSKGTFYPNFELVGDTTFCRIREFVGIAELYVYDAFNATQGRRVALGRALHLAGFTKAERKEYQRAFDDFCKWFNEPDRPPKKRKKRSMGDMSITDALAPDITQTLIYDDFKKKILKGWWPVS